MGDQPTTAAGAAGVIGQALVTSLPAQFLVLVLLNTAFIGGMLWFLDRQDANRERVAERAMDARERVLMPLLKVCVERGPPP